MNDLDLLKLAQLHNAEGNLLKEHKLNLVKKINVHYSIPTETYEILHKHSYIGYNCLHIAAMNLDCDFIHELINRGADLFKQGTLDHKTPLHVAVDSLKKRTCVSIWEISDELQSCQAVDTLLSAHVASDNSLNPTCKNGISHLHIACMFNCTVLVAFLLKNGESVDQVTNANALWPAYTPLHFAARYSCVETAQCLINNGANVIAKDAKGVSPLHILIERLLHKINHVSLDRFISDKLYEEEIKKIQAIVSTLIENTIRSIVLDDTGLTVLHIACTLRDTSIAAQILKDTVELNKPVNIDSKFWAGWTPLHFAACSSVEMVKLLVESGADITVKNERKQTPLDICLKRYYPSDVHSILSTRDEFRSILFSDNETSLLDLLVTMNRSDRLKSYLESLENPNIFVPFASPILPGYSLLHLTLSMKEKQKFPQTIDFLPQDDHCPQHVFENFSKKVRACLAKGCSVTAKNLDGLTPIHLAFNTHCSPSTVAELLSKCKQDTLDPDDLPLLHIACAINHLPSVKRLIRARQANVNAVANKSFQWRRDDSLWMSDSKKGQCRVHAVNAKSTPLHVAVAFTHADVVGFLLDSGADVYAKDAEGFTPIHLFTTVDHPFYYESVALAILNKAGALEDRTSREGLTHLHVAAYAGQSAAVRGLVANGANVNCVVGSEVPEFLSRFAGKTPLKLAVEMSPDIKTIEALVELGADTYVDGLVQHMLSIDQSLARSFFDRLKLRGDARGPIEPSGLTLLHVACARLDVDWAGELLRKGADVNAKMNDNRDCEGWWKGYTPLHVLAYRACKFRKHEEFIPRLRRLANLLLMHNADVSIVSDRGSALHINVRLFDRVPNFRKSIGSPSGHAPVNVAQGSTRLPTPFDKMLQVNPTDSKGTSYFHLVCARNDAREIVEKFLCSGVDINHSECPFFGYGNTALHFAVRENLSFETACLLMRRRANVNAEDRYGNTPLHVSVRHWRWRQQLLYYLKSYGADFNAKNIRGETPADILMYSEGYTVEILQYFLRSGSSITLKKRETIRGIIMNALNNDRLEILQTFVNICDIKNAVAKYGYNPIQEFFYYFPQTENHHWNMETFNTKNYLWVIQVFVNADCDVNQGSKNGESPLQTAISRRNYNAIEALLQAGADVNDVKSDENMNITEVRKLISFHVGKMKALGLRVSATCTKIYDSSEETLMDFEKTFKSDIEKAKSFEIMGLTVTANDFLSEETVALYSGMLPNERRDIDIFFKRIAHLNEQFPQLAGLMICQYKKAARSHRIKSAKAVLTLEYDMHLPDLCLEGILYHFEHNELEYLLEDSDGASNTR